MDPTQGQFDGIPSVYEQLLFAVHSSVAGIFAINRHLHPKYMHFDKSQM